MEKKIYPTVARDYSEEVNGEQSISNILLCRTVNDNGEVIQVKEGSLFDLQELLKELLENRKVDCKFDIDLVLDCDKASTYTRRSLDELLDDSAFLNKYQRVVICRPDQYIDSNAYRQCEDKLTKLIFCDTEECNTDLKQFYKSYEDTWDRKKMNIQFYKNLKSLALQWIDAIIELFLGRTPNRTENTLAGGTF